MSKTIEEYETELDNAIAALNNLIETASTEGHLKIQVTSRQCWMYRLNAYSRLSLEHISKGVNPDERNTNQTA